MVHLVDVIKKVFECTVFGLLYSTDRKESLLFRLDCSTVIKTKHLNPKHTLLQNKKLAL